MEIKEQTEKNAREGAYVTSPLGERGTSLMA
jgi:hypothetical protein